MDGKSNEKKDRRARAEPGRSAPMMAPESGMEKMGVDGDRDSSSVPCLNYGSSAVEELSFSVFELTTSMSSL